MGINPYFQLSISETSQSQLIIGTTYGFWQNDTDDKEK